MRENDIFSFFSRENFCTIFIFNAPFLYRVDVSLYDLMTTTNVVSVLLIYNIIPTAITTTTPSSSSGRKRSVVIYHPRKALCTPTHSNNTTHTTHCTHTQPCELKNIYPHHFKLKTTICWNQRRSNDFCNWHNWLKIFTVHTNTHNTKKWTKYLYKNVRANRLTIYRLLELLPAGCCVELLVLCVCDSLKQRQEHWNTGTATTE